MAARPEGPSSTGEARELGRISGLLSDVRAGVRTCARRCGWCPVPRDGGGCAARAASVDHRSPPFCPSRTTSAPTQTDHTAVNVSCPWLLPSGGVGVVETAIRGFDEGGGVAAFQLIGSSSASPGLRSL